MKLFSKVGAEFLGTLFLTLSIGVSITFGGGLPTPVVAALTLGTLVYILGAVSGGHFNPAISIMLWTTRHLSFRALSFYLGAQLLGGLLASVILLKVYGQIPTISESTFGVSFLSEVIGAFVFGFGVSGVASGKSPEGSQGLAVAGSLLLGISLAAPLSAGILNPAVALGLSAFNLAFILGPIVGALIGGIIFSLLTKHE